MCSLAGVIQQEEACFVQGWEAILGAIRGVEDAKKPDTTRFFGENDVRKL